MIPLGLKETKELDLLVPLRVSFGVSLIDAEAAEIHFPVWKNCQKINSWRGAGLKTWESGRWGSLQSRKERGLLLSMGFLVGRSGKFLDIIARNLPLNHKNQDFLLFPNPGFHQWTLWRRGCPVWKGNQGIHGAATGWCPLASKVWLVQDHSLEMPHFLWGGPLILSPNSMFILLFQGAAFPCWIILDLVYRFQNITGIVNFPCPQWPADLQMSSNKIYRTIIIYEY